MFSSTQPVKCYTIVFKTQKTTYVQEKNAQADFVHGAALLIIIEQNLVALQQKIVWNLVVLTCSSELINVIYRIRPLWCDHNVLAFVENWSVFTGANKWQNRKTQHKGEFLTEKLTGFKELAWSDRKLRKQKTVWQMWWVIVSVSMESHEGFSMVLGGGAVIIWWGEQIRGVLLHPPRTVNHRAYIQVNLMSAVFLTQKLCHVYWVRLKRNITI